MFDITVEWTRFTNSTPPLISKDAPYIEMDVTIIPDWNKSVYLTWEPPQALDAGIGDDVVYTVYYSESEYGPFTSLMAQPTSDLSFFTTWQIQSSKVFEQFFTIECLFSDGRRYRSYPETPAKLLSKWHRLRHKDIIRREAILLDKFTGVESIIWNPKYSGKRCPECWDPVHLKVMDDNCETCYGRSYEGGFDTGMLTKLQYSGIDPQSHVSYQGRTEPIQLSAWTIPFPMIMPDAIILRMPDRRVFIVEGHQGSTEMLTNLQRQFVVLKELSRSAIENRLFDREDVVSIPLRKPHVHH